jgi:hypothetical protein
VADVEYVGRLPHAELGVVAEHWLVQPFGTPGLATLAWFLIVVGAIGWWRAGRRHLVLMATTASICYLVTAAWTMHFHTSVRYIQPVLPCLAMLAAGVTVLRSRPLARVATSAACVLAALSTVWAAPVLTLRAREPAPLWAALEWTRDHATDSTLVVYDRGCRPHALYVLGPAGVTTAMVGTQRADAWTGDAWRVHIDRSVTRGEVLFEARWPRHRIGRLIRGRYLAASVVDRDR